MATFRYFADLDGTQTELTPWGSLRNADFAAKFPGVKGKKCDSFSRWIGKDSNGVVLPITRSIQRKNNPSMHKCDARCLNATGFLCECSCGGKNHGAGNFMCEAA
jgi:hypothetical protein